MDHCGCTLESGRISPHSLLIQRQRTAHAYLSMVEPSMLRDSISSGILSSLSAPFSFPALGLTSWKVPGAVLHFLIFYWHRIDSRGDRKEAPLSLLWLCFSHRERGLSVSLPVFNLHFFLLQKSTLLRLETMPYLPFCARKQVLGEGSSISFW